MAQPRQNGRQHTLTPRYIFIPRFFREFSQVNRVIKGFGFEVRNLVYFKQFCRSWAKVYYSTVRYGTVRYGTVQARHRALLMLVSGLGAAAPPKVSDISSAQGSTEQHRTEQHISSRVRINSREGAHIGARQTERM